MADFLTVSWSSHGAGGYASDLSLGEVSIELQEWVILPGYQAKERGCLVEPRP